MKIYKIVAENVCHQICHAIFQDVKGQAEMKDEGKFRLEMENGNAFIIEFVGDEILFWYKMGVIIQLYWDIYESHYDIANKIVETAKKFK